MQVELSSRMGSVSAIGEDFGKSDDAWSQGSSTIPASVSSYGLARDHAGSRWLAYRIVGEIPFEQDANIGKSIDIRRFDLRISHASEMVVTELVGDKAEDVGPVLRFRHD